MDNIIFYLKNNIVYIKKDNYYIEMDVVKTFPTIAVLETNKIVKNLEYTEQLSFQELKERIYE